MEMCREIAILIQQMYPLHLLLPMLKEAITYIENYIHRYRIINGVQEWDT